MNRFFLPLLSLFFLLPFSLAAQENGKGLMSASYRESVNGSDLSNVKKYFSLIYNQTHCQLTISGVTYYFKLMNYKQTISKGLVTEEFTNEQTPTLPAEWFNIVIKNKLLRETIVSITLPNAKDGHLYHIPNAKPFSVHSGKTTQSDILNWQSFQTKQETQEGYEKGMTAQGLDYETQKRIRDSLIAVRIDSVLSRGDNINTQQIRWIADTVASRIQLEKGEVFYKEFKIIINAEGKVTRVLPVGPPEKIIEKYLPRISEIIKSYTLTPYKGSNGKLYPSYKVMYIRLLPGI
jgi:hypothetical protein